MEKGLAIIFNKAVASQNIQVVLYSNTNFEIYFKGPIPEPYLLVASKRKIAIVDLKSNYSKIVFDGDVNIRKFVIDPINKKMYITNGKVVYRMSFEGSDKEVIYKNKYHVIQELAFDWIGRRMFWVFSKESTIYVGNRIVSPQTSDGVVGFPISGKIISSLKIDPVAG